MKSINIGVIGLSGRGKLADLAHRPKKNIQLIAGADPNKNARTDFKNRIKSEVSLYDNYEEMLDKESLDAVFITSPDFCHEDQAVKALQKGISVYLEKPMAITVKGCDRILKTAYENKGKLMLGHNMRYMQFVQKIKELIDSGIIGEVKAIWCRHFVSYGGDAYFRDWHSERKNSTSLLLQKAAHDIDIIHYFANSFTETISGFGKLALYGNCKKRAPEEAPKVTFNEKHWPPLEQEGFSPKIDIEDINMINMELQNGVMCSYQQCHFTPDSSRNYTIIGTKGRIENYGDCGTGVSIEVWNERKDDFRLFGDQSIKIDATVGGHGGADNKIVDAFIEYVQNKKAPLTSPIASRYAVAAGCMGAKSVRAGGQPFQVPKMEKEIENYFQTIKT